MKKSFLATLIFGLIFALCLAGCSASSDSSQETDGQDQESAVEEQKIDDEGEEINVLENSDMLVLGAYIDESYDGSEDKDDIKRLYVFTEITPTTGTVETSSAGFDMTVSKDDASDKLESSDVVLSDSDGGSTLARLASSYTCTNTISKITPGKTEGIIIPFNVPSFYVQEGATFSLSDSKGISDGITFGFDYIQDKKSLKAIAKTADNDGYAKEMKARKNASSKTAKKVMNKLDGYEYYIYIGGAKQTYSFEGNRFTTTAVGQSVSGTYTVKNGYLACKQSATGWVTWIPWKYSKEYENGIDVDISISSIFVEK